MNADITKFLNTKSTARDIAAKFCEATSIVEAAQEALKPLAVQQIEITRKAYAACDIEFDRYDQRGYRYYDWIVFDTAGYHEGDGEHPAISCQLWERGRCGGNDGCDTTFILSKHIINGQPELFEAELMAKLETCAQKEAREKEEQKKRDIARLQAQLAALQGDTQ